MEAFARSEDLQCEPSVTVKGQCDSEATVSSPLVINENKEANTCELSLYDPNVAAVNILNLRSNELVEVPVAVAVAVTDSHHSHSLDTGTQDIQANNKAIGPSRSWEDGFNWRKYGQKHIKGNEFPRSYYKCSHPNCQVKKQVEQSHDGRITDVIYRGTHDHPKPQSVSHMAAPCTFSSGQGDKPSSGNGQVSHHAKPNDVPERSKPNETSERSYIVTSDKEVEGAELSRIRDEIQDSNDNPESKRRCLNFNTELTSDSAPNHERCRDVLEVNQGRSEAFTSSSSNENVTAADGSHEITLPVPAPHPPSDMAITSNALVPVGVDLDNLQQTQRSDIGVQTMLTDQKRSCPTVDRFWGDGYNWRKYGQKHIKGSEFPRSYYRCTHPNCQVKKQLGCSHDGQITDIVYKGEHNHPRPLPNSHIAVGRILSIQEEGFERVSSLNQTYDKSSTEQTTRHTELNGTPELYPVQKSETDGQNGSSKVNRTDNRVEQNADLYSNSGELASKETGNAAAAELNHHQCKPSVEVEGQSQCQALVSSPSVTNKDTDISPRDLTPSAVSNSPVYMVTSRGIVPVEVDTEEKRQRASTANTVEVEESHSNGLSLPMTEKLLENAYHWRKYGQKNIKGSEFPRSYYRCTHPNCQVKMQMERSHDGRIIEIIYKGKHDHPKPQPLTRMAIGAILSLEEDISDKISDDSCDKLSNGHVQTAVCTNPSPFPEYSPVTPSAEIVEAAGQKLSRSFSEIENYNDMESTKRRKDIGDMDFTPVIRTPREPRVVVETLSEVDVVDDGYRWQKYGRKIVKGNSHPRNYYRCSTGGCTVKKHVERAANNPKAVVTTYEGKHNHDLPRARITTHDIAGLAGKTNDSNDMLVARSGELFANGIDAGATSTSTPVHRMYEREERVDMDTIKNQSNNTDPDTSKVMEPVSVAANMCEREERVDMEIIKRQSNNTDPETSKVMEPVSVAANMYEREERVDMESIQSRSNITDPDSSKVMEAVSVAGNLYEREERVDMETSRSRPNIIDPDTDPVSVAAHNGDQNEDADQDRLDKNEGKSICLTPSLDHSANPKAENMES